MKIANAGFQHETNTFASPRAGKDEFLMADSRLGRLTADGIITATRGIYLDLHGNISSDLVDAAIVMTIYRRYSHLDMADSGAWCMRYLIDALNQQQHFNAVEFGKKSTSSKPIDLADVPDNPGAGATSDTTGLLQMLLDAEASKDVVTFYISIAHCLHTSHLSV
jgi:microcystin degradation protein MlrC